LSTHRYQLARSTLSVRQVDTQPSVGWFSGFDRPRNGLRSSRRYQQKSVEPRSGSTTAVLADEAEFLGEVEHGFGPGTGGTDTAVIGSGGRIQACERATRLIDLQR
jgi:hypothetical protein